MKRTQHYSTEDLNTKKKVLGGRKKINRLLKKQPIEENGQMYVGK